MRIHCGSENALAQRVAALPSTAKAAFVPAFSSLDAIAGLLSARSVVWANRGMAARTTAKNARLKPVPAA